MEDTPDKNLSIYPIWSNFIYFISAIYAFAVGIFYPISKPYKGLFIILGVIIFLAGLFSVLYHIETPSHKHDSTAIHSEEYTRYSDLDVNFAILLCSYMVVLFLFVLITTLYKHLYKTGVNYYIPIIGPNKLISYPLFKEPSFYLTILFAIIGIVFYVISNDYGYKSIHKCNNDICFTKYTEAYDIFHSNWHLFTGVMTLFFITMIKNSFTW